MRDYVKKNSFFPKVGLLFVVILMCFLFMSPGVTLAGIDSRQAVEIEASVLDLDQIDSYVIAYKYLNDNAMNYNYLHVDTKYTVDHLNTDHAVDIPAFRIGTMLKYPILAS